MCGITGIKAFNEVGRIHMIRLAAATHALAKRGPDSYGSYTDYYVGLGHRRLSIIDVSAEANQPMADATGRYHIVFNGEIFNYRQLKQSLQQKGIAFQTESDTEVLLQLFILYGKGCLDQLNGFFSFAIYDSAREELFLARDRMGIKPLYYYADEDKFLFASEMKAIVAFNIPKELSADALLIYLQLNYIPAPLTIFNGVNKLLPGHCISVSKNGISLEQWYEIPLQATFTPNSYANAGNQLRELLTSAVKHRLIADVPVGTFLSGGIDSSVITGIASKLQPGIQSFSIGYMDNPFFDETDYAEAVADHFGTSHTVFKLSNDDLLSHVGDMVDYIDEPFADSSALPVYILSRETKKQVSVALSGDGADELFAGYNKHIAWQQSLQHNLSNSLVSGLLPVWRMLPASRSSRAGNKIRQLTRYAEGLKLTPAERYWRWASFLTETAAMQFLHSDIKDALNEDALQTNKHIWLAGMRKKADLDSFLRTDCKLVLPDDMLAKIDRMSMAHGLEVRVPFLDHRIVSFAFGLPAAYKLKGNFRKRILQDAFKDFLPEKLYNRPKKGFEVPLLHWMRHELKSTLDEVVFNKEMLNAQAVFNSEEMFRLKSQLNSSNPGDAHATIWALFVFQKWWKKYMEV